MTVSAPKPKAAPRGRPFSPGQSGNPAGRPRGSRNKATVMVEAIVEARLSEVADGAVARALAGDAAATRLVLKPYLPRRPLPEFELPEIETASDVRDASAAVLRAATDGVLDAKEALVLHRLVEARAQLLGYKPPDAPPRSLHLQFEPRQPGEPPAPQLTRADVDQALGREAAWFDALPAQDASPALPAAEADVPQVDGLAVDDAAVDAVAAAPPEPDPAPPPEAPPAEPEFARRIVINAPRAMRVREIRPWLIGQGLEPQPGDVVEPNRPAPEPVVDRIEPHRREPRGDVEPANFSRDEDSDTGGDPREDHPAAISNPVFSAENS